MGKKDQPELPDPIATANAQTGGNVQTAIANRVLGAGNQVTPWGSQTQQRTGSTIMNIGGRKVRIPEYTTKTTLASNVARGERFAQDGANQLARRGLNQIDEYKKTDRNMSYGTDFSADRQRVEDAIMGRMQGGMDRDRGQLEDRLASQGIGIGSEAYQAAMDDLNRGVNDARLGAVISGGQEQSRMVGMERDRAEFENNSRDQSLQEIMSMLQGGRAQLPNFQGSQPGGIATTDVAGLVNQNYAQQQQQYQQRQSGMGGILGGIGALLASPSTSLFGTLLASDRRVKENIKKVGKTTDGQQIYSYKYKSGGPIQLGLMAQDVEKRNPDAVTTVGGVKMVDYGKALGGAQA